VDNDSLIIIEFYVAGLRYRDFEGVKDQLEEGMEVKLIPEPQNLYDPYAIKVMRENWWLGYVPMKGGQSMFIAKELAGGTKFKAEIVKLDPFNSDYWKRLRVSVKEEMPTLSPE